MPAGSNARRVPNSGLSRIEPDARVNEQVVLQTREEMDDPIRLLRTDIEVIERADTHGGVELPVKHAESGVEPTTKAKSAGAFCVANLLRFAFQGSSLRGVLLGMRAQAFPRMSFSLALSRVVTRNAHVEIAQ